MLNACFQQELDDYMYLSLSQGRDSTSVAQYSTSTIIYGDFVMEEMETDHI